MNDPHENATWVYEYDRGGNMTERKKYAYTTGALDGLTYTLRSYTYDSTWKDLLTANGPYPLTYDAMGNLKTYADWVYEWEGGRQLKKQTQNEKVVTYKYDCNGMRISKTFSHTNGTVYAVTNYTYSGTKLVHMTKNSDALHFFYDNQGRPAKVKYNGEMYTYLHNLQGDIVGIIDGNGTLVVEYKYNAWGSILSRVGTLANTLGYSNPFRYRGYIYDDETCMYWLQNRYYYPELYRFICGDLLISSHKSILNHHIFAYCINNPIMQADPSGFDAIDAEGSCGSARLNICSGNERIYQEKKKKSDKLVQAAKDLANNGGGIITLKYGLKLYCYPNNMKDIKEPSDIYSAALKFAIKTESKNYIKRNFVDGADRLKRYAKLNNLFKIRNGINSVAEYIDIRMAKEQPDSIGYIKVEIPYFGTSASTYSAACEYEPWNDSFFTPDEWRYDIVSVEPFS